jgi:hypothetical protein
MSDKSAPEESASKKEVHEKSGAPYIEVSGSSATRELRDTSRRRREAEEKLQQHLMEAKEHAHEAEHHAHEKAHPKADGGHDSAHGGGSHESGSPKTGAKDADPKHADGTKRQDS